MDRHLRTGAGPFNFGSISLQGGISVVFNDTTSGTYNFSGSVSNTGSTLTFNGTGTYNIAGGLYTGGGTTTSFNGAGTYKIGKYLTSCSGDFFQHLPHRQRADLCWPKHLCIDKWPLRQRWRDHDPWAPAPPRTATSSARSTNGYSINMGGGSFVTLNDASWHRRSVQGHRQHYQWRRQLPGTSCRRRARHQWLCQSRRRSDARHRCLYDLQLPCSRCWRRRRGHLRRHIHRIESQRCVNRHRWQHDHQLQQRHNCILRLRRLQQCHADRANQWQHHEHRRTRPHNIDQLGRCGAHRQARPAQTVSPAPSTSPMGNSI